MEPIIALGTRLGPRVVDDLRPYCPQGYLGLFDEFCRAAAPVDGPPAAHDMPTRLAEMDRAGIAGAVVSYGGPLPFAGALDRTAAVGIHMGNAWLADQLAHQRARHVGCVLLPAWDIDATVHEIEWGHSVGFRSVDLPLVEFSDPAWDKVWSVCEELAMPLTMRGALPDGIAERYPDLRSVLATEDVMAADSAVQVYGFDLRALAEITTAVR